REALMSHRFACFLLLAAIMLVAVAPAQAQREKAAADADPFSSQPDPSSVKTIDQCWKWIEFYLKESPDFTQAGLYLKQLLRLNPTPDQLVAELHDKEGIGSAKVVKMLRDVPSWSDDPEEDKKVKKAVADLTEQLERGVRTLRTSDAEIVKWVKQLQQS